MTDTLRIVAMSGSLRQKSFNSALLRACKDLTPDGMTIEIHDIRPIPFYDDDMRLAGYPPVVEALRTAVRESDGVLFASPEYNRSISGVLKNTIDWLSRVPDMPLFGKPAAIMGCSRGVLGTAFANYHMRQVLAVLNVYAMPGKEVMINGAPDKFDEDLNLVDEATREFVREHLERFAKFARALK